MCAAALNREAEGIEIGDGLFEIFDADHQVIE